MELVGSTPTDSTERFNMYQEEHDLVSALFDKYMDESSRKHILVDANKVISSIAICISQALMLDGPTPLTLNYVKACLEMLYCEGRNSNIELDSIWHD